MALNIHYSYTKLEVFNLYFFCWKDRLRISMQLNPHTQSVCVRPSWAHTQFPGLQGLPSSPQSTLQVCYEDDWQQMLLRGLVEGGHSLC